MCDECLRSRRFDSRVDFEGKSMLGSHCNKTSNTHSSAIKQIFSRATLYFDCSLEFLTHTSFFIFMRMSSVGCMLYVDGVLLQDYQKCHTCEKFEC